MQYHDENDCSKYCCLSSVKRWAFIISENLCIDLNIRLIAGKHYPIGVKCPRQLTDNYSANNDAKCAAWAAEAKTLRSLIRYDLNQNLDAFNPSYEFVKLQEDALSKMTSNFIDLGK